MTGAGAARAQAARAPKEPKFASRSQKQASKKNYNGRGAATESSRLPRDNALRRKHCQRCSARSFGIGLGPPANGKSAVAVPRWRRGIGGAGLAGRDRKIEARPAGVLAAAVPSPSRRINRVYAWSASS
jgi:hypothetical protein